MALNDCLLESYIRCYEENIKTVRKHYVKEALLLDQQVCIKIQCVIFVNML